MRRLLLLLALALAACATTPPAGAPATVLDDEALPSLFSFERRALTDPAAPPYFARLPEPDNAAGAVGYNAAWEAGKADVWDISLQRVGEKAVVGGVVTGNRAAISRGLRILEWGYARQTPEGAFGDSRQQPLSNAFFVWASAHALLVLEASDQREVFADRIEAMKPKVELAADWLVANEHRVWAKSEQFTHRYWLNAAALGLTSRLLGRPGYLDLAHRLIDHGAALQAPDGYNPELGGYDSDYHAAGLRYAIQWSFYQPTDARTDKAERMLVHGLEWLATRVMANGDLNLEGNTRVYEGSTKSVSYETISAVFSVWGAHQGIARWQELGQRVWSFRHGGQAVGPVPAPAPRPQPGVTQPGAETAATVPSVPSAGAQPAPVPGPEGDPALGVEVGRVSNVRSMLRRGVRAAMRCPVACRVTAVLQVRRGRRWITVGRGRGASASAGRVAARVSVTRRGRALVRRSRGALRVRVTAVEPGGRRQTVAVPLARSRR